MLPYPSYLLLLLTTTATGIFFFYFVSVWPASFRSFLLSFSLSLSFLSFSFFISFFHSSLPLPINMGNSQTKEARASLGPSQRRSNHPSGSGRSPYGDRHHSDGSRSGRSSRPDLSLLGIVPSAERDVATLEHRRETRQEREARRLEKERAARVKER